MESEKTIELKNGYKLQISQEENAGSPDTWENNSFFLVYSHRDLNVQRPGFHPSDISDALNEGLESEPDYYPLYYIFPVDAYIHSGIHLSIANTKNYPDRRWDVSTSGYVLVSKEEFESRDEALNVAKNLLEEWNLYLNGEVYCFTLLRPVKKYSITEQDLNELLANGETISASEFANIAEEEIHYEETDSCWGFYGQDWEINGMKEHIPKELWPESEETVR